MYLKDVAVACPEVSLCYLGSGGIVGTDKEYPEFLVPIPGDGFCGATI
jgi:hypothetical protein